MTKELIEIARAIEAHRSGVYIMTNEERAAIADARKSALVPDDEASSFWKRRRIG